VSETASGFASKNWQCQTVLGKGEAGLGFWKTMCSKIIVLDHLLQLPRRGARCKLLTDFHSSQQFYAAIKPMSLHLQEVFIIFTTSCLVGGNEMLAETRSGCIAGTVRDKFSF
jgi:hypothetical protein